MVYFCQSIEYDFPLLPPLLHSSEAFHRRHLRDYNLVHGGVLEMKAILFQWLSSSGVIWKSALVS